MPMTAITIVIGRPGGVSGILELGISQFREFEPRRVHTHIRGDFFLSTN